MIDLIIIDRNFLIIMIIFGVVFYLMVPVAKIMEKSK